MANNRQLLKQQADLVKELNDLRQLINGGEKTVTIATATFTHIAIAADCEYENFVEKLKNNTEFKASIVSLFYPIHFCEMHVIRYFITRKVISCVQLEMM
jgi:hypothetical protein